MAAAGLADRIEILQLDYRDLEERAGPAVFDKVASVGMFEHVGLRNLPEYFAIAATMVRPGGIPQSRHHLGRHRERRRWAALGRLHRSVHLSARRTAARASRGARDGSASFELCDIESLRRHYALTLSHWSRRLEEHLDEAGASRRPDPAGWRAYLAGCAYGFAKGWMNIYQLLGTRPYQDGRIEVPLTRDWLYR